MEGETEGYEMQRAKEGKGGDRKPECQSFGDHGRPPLLTFRMKRERFLENLLCFQDQPSKWHPEPYPTPSCALAPKSHSTGSNQVFLGDIQPTPEGGMPPFKSFRHQEQDHVPQT